MDAHNAGTQLERSLGQYDDWGHLFEMYVPIGAAFSEGGWEVTVADIREFITKIGYLESEYEIPGYGFWDLDDAIKHPAWLDAIAGAAPAPPPPNLSRTIEIKGLHGVATLRLRDAPWGRVVGYTWNGARFVWEGIEYDDDGEQWFKIGESIYVAGWYTKPV